MPNYHLSIQIISRNKGRSAVAAAAYRAGERIKNEYDGYTHDYTNKKDIAHKEILLPDHAPGEYKDRTTLWNAVEKIEGNSNAQLAREIEFSLPVELSMEQNIRLAHEYVKKHFVDEGMIADVCVHESRDGTNPHAHVMLILRPLGQDGTWGAKSRKEYMLDDKGERIRLPSKISKDGKEILGEYKSRKVYTVDWNDKDKVEVWRKGWADIQNKYLEQNGIAELVDHRSYERQGNGLIPTIHMGVAASQMEKKGIRTDKGNHNRQVAITNSEIKQTKARIRKVKNWLYAQPLHNAPTLMDIMGGVVGGKNLQSQWQKIRNLQTSAKVLNFLTENNITDMDEFSNKVVQIHEQLKTTTDDIKKAERRLETLAEHLAHAENIKTHKAVYKKYKALTPKKDTAAMNSLNPFTKKKATADYEAAVQKYEAYHDKHADEIQAYENAVQHFDNVMNGRTQLPINDWQAEQKKLLAKRYNLCDKFYTLKEEIKSVEVLRRSVENLMREDLQMQRGQPQRVHDVGL